jgi:hypothetical protein
MIALIVQYVDGDAQEFKATSFSIEENGVLVIAEGRQMTVIPLTSIVRYGFEAPEEEEKDSKEV